MFEALKAATNRQEEIEFALNKQPKCPHCGAEFDIDRNEAWHLYSDDDSDESVECDACGREFEVRVHCTYRFSTDDQPAMDEDNEPHNAAMSGAEPASSAERPLDGTVMQREAK